MNKNTFGIGTLLMLCLLKTSGVAAVDGDVSYTAPYLWVDPETGQISTVNPGPEPKVHTETSGTTQARTPDSETPAVEPKTTHPSEQTED